MPRSRCVLAALLFATLAIAVCQIVVQDLPNDYYDQNRRNEYQYNEYQHNEYQPRNEYRNEYREPRRKHKKLLFGPIVVKEGQKDRQDLSKIPGVPGIDYPLFHTVPHTSFSCARVPVIPGIYANVETGCQAYHMCHDGREGHQGASFLCANGTLFNQNEFACDWWYNVNCMEAPYLFSLNADPLKNPFVPQEKKDALRKKWKIVVQ